MHLGRIKEGNLKFDFFGISMTKKFSHDKKSPKLTFTLNLSLKNSDGF